MVGGKWEGGIKKFKGELEEIKMKGEVYMRTLGFSYILFYLITQSN